MPILEELIVQAVSNAGTCFVFCFGEMKFAYQVYFMVFFFSRLLLPADDVRSDINWISSDTTVLVSESLFVRSETNTLSPGTYSQC